MLAQIAVETKLPGSTRPAHPQPPKSIANAETLATPQLPTHLAAPPATPSTSPPAMPAPIAKPPGSRPAVQNAADDADAFGAEHHADPAEVVALHQADANAASGVREGRDVLAGWGWSTGSVQALDDDEAEDALRRSRRNLVIAIGGALGVVIIIVIAAFAFSGSKKPDERDRHGAIAQPSPTAAISATAPETPIARPGQPTDPTATANADSVKAEPPAAQPAPGEPPGPGAVVPPHFDSAKPEPAQVDPSKTEPKAEPPKAEPPKAESPKVTAAPKAEPPTSETAKLAAAPRPMAPKAEPPKPEPAKAVDARKPSETKKPPDKAVKHPPAPEKIAKPSSRAQPVDPYAVPETRKTDPSTAYRTGLQQYAHGDTAGALATFRGSLATNPGFAPTWRGIGLVYEKMGNKGQARAAFKRYLQLAPTAGDADQIRDRMERLGS
jgi:hypothetical protein